MSTLVVEDITSAGLEQKFRLLRNTALKALRLHLYKNGTPTGNLVIEIKEGVNVIKTITTAAATINAEFTEDYGHGVFKFDLDLPLRKDGIFTEYTIKLSHAAYTSTDYYSWTKDWLPTKTNLYGTGVTLGSTLQDTLKPYSFELYFYE